MNNEMDTILYVGGFELPDKNAAAHRVLNNARLLRELGYEVVFCGVDREISKKETSEVKKVDGFDNTPISRPSNLAYSEHARKYLHECGLPKERTYVTGSPMAEVLRANLDKIRKSDILERLGLEKKKYILLSAHREENIDTEKISFRL